MDMGRLKEVVKTAQKARNKEMKEIRAFIRKQKPLDWDEFWMEMDRFTGAVSLFRDGRGLAEWAEHAADEFFRSAICEANGVGSVGTWKRNHEAGFEAMVRCLRFVVAYEDIVSRVHDAFRRMEDDGVHRFYLGDDSFDDMCDSFPLHGRKAYEAVLEGVVPRNPELGENYVAMRLNEASEKWVRRCVHDLDKGREGTAGG